MMSIRHRAVGDSPIGPICRGETIPEELFYVSEHASRTECDKVTRLSGKLMSGPVR